MIYEVEIRPQRWQTRFLNGLSYKHVIPPELVIDPQSTELYTIETDGIIGRS